MLDAAAVPAEQQSTAEHVAARRRRSVDAGSACMSALPNVVQPAATAERRSEVVADAPQHIFSDDGKTVLWEMFHDRNGKKVERYRLRTTDVYFSYRHCLSNGILRA